MELTRLQLKKKIDLGLSSSLKLKMPQMHKTTRDNSQGMLRIMLGSQLSGPLGSSPDLSVITLLTCFKFLYSYQEEFSTVLVTVTPFARELKIKNNLGPFGAHQIACNIFLQKSSQEL